MNKTIEFDGKYVKMNLPMSLVWEGGIVLFLIIMAFGLFHIFLPTILIYISFMIIGIPLYYMAGYYIKKIFIENW